MRGLGQYCACLEMLVIKKTNSTPSQMQQLITNLTEMLYVLLALSFQSVLVVASTEQYQNYELTRTKLAKTMDGLEVQYRILKSSYVSTSNHALKCIIEQTGHCCRELAGLTLFPRLEARW